MKIENDWGPRCQRHAFGLRCQNFCQQKQGQKDESATSFDQSN